jgi:hypothetical protein
MLEALDDLDGGRADPDDDSTPVATIRTPRRGGPPTLVRIRLRRAWSYGLEFHAANEVLMVEVNTANRLVDAHAADWE